MKENDEIDDLFRSSFDDFSVEPPPHVKISIDEKIDFKRKIKGGYYKGFIFSILSILLIGSVYLLNSSKSEKNLSASTETTTNESNVSEKESKENVSTEEELIPNNVISKSKEPVYIKEEQKSTSINSTAKPSKTAEKLKSTTPSKITSTSTPSKIISSTSAVTTKTTVNSARTASNKKNALATKKKKRKRNTSPKDIYPASKNVTNSENPEARKEIKVEGKENEISSNLVENKSTSPLETTPLITPTKTAIDSVNNIENSISLIESKSDSTIEAADELKQIPISKWRLSSHVGQATFSNKIGFENEYSIKENNSIYFNIEATRLLKNKCNATFGFQANQYLSDLSKSTSVTSYFQNGVDSIGFDTTLNVVISVPNFDTLQTNVVAHQHYSVSNFSIPLYFGYTQKIYKNIFLDATAGALIGYQSAKLIANDLNLIAPTIHSFGVKACIRPQLRYQFNRFGVSVSSNFGYDLIPTLNWNGINRKRSYVEFGVGLHFNL